MTPTSRRRRRPLALGGALVVPLLLAGLLRAATGAQAREPQSPTRPAPDGSPPSAGSHAPELPSDARELLERCRLEQELVLAEPTAVMLGELLQAEADERSGVERR